MKVLEFHHLKPEDSLALNFRGALFDRQAALEGELEPFFQVLEEYAGEWMPDVVEGKRRRKYSRAAIWKGWRRGVAKEARPSGSIARSGLRWIRRSGSGSRLSLLHWTSRSLCNRYPSSRKRSAAADSWTWSARGLLVTRSPMLQPTAWLTRH